MTLAEYIKDSGLRKGEFAALIQVSSAYLSNILNGSRHPNLYVATRIENLTDGKVLATSWVTETEIIAWPDAARDSTK